MAIYNHVLTNPDAETGDTTGWTDETNVMAVSSENSTYGLLGSYFFYGGSYAETETYQQIDLVTDGVPTADIDSETLKIVVLWAQSSSDGDAAAIDVRYKDSSQTVISTDYSEMTSVAARKWMTRKLIKTIPANTRYIDIILHFVRLSGTSSDGFIDQIKAMTMDFVDYPITSLTNLDAETGDLTGWTTETGCTTFYATDGSTVPDPYEGSYYFSGYDRTDVGSDIAMVYQRIDLVNEGIPAATIDAGTMWADLSGYRSSYAVDNDPGQFQLRFLDTNQDEIYTISNEILTTPTTWTKEQCAYGIPANTRYIDIILYGEWVGGNYYINAGFDAIEFSVYDFLIIDASMQIFSNSIEVLYQSTDPSVHIAQNSIEVLYQSTDPSVHIAQNSIEVLYSMPTSSKKKVVVFVG